MPPISPLPPPTNRSGQMSDWPLIYIYHGIKTLLITNPGTIILISLISLLVFYVSTYIAAIVNVIMFPASTEPQSPAAVAIGLVISLLFSAILYGAVLSFVGLALSRVLLQSARNFPASIGDSFLHTMPRFILACKVIIMYALKLAVITAAALTPLLFLPAGLTIALPIALTIVWAAMLFIALRIILTLFVLADEHAPVTTFQTTGQVVSLTNINRRAFGLLMAVAGLSYLVFQGLPPRGQEVTTVIIERFAGNGPSVLSLVMSSLLYVIFLSSAAQLYLDAKAALALRRQGKPVTGAVQPSTSKKPPAAPKPPASPTNPTILGTV